MPAYYTLRMQFGPHRDTQTVSRELEQLCRRVPVDEVMLFMYGEEQCDGHPTLEQVARWLGTLRPWKQLLENMGVRVSLNPWTVLGVCDRGRRLKAGQNWRTMVNWQGRASQLVVCPLDATWQEYFKGAISLMAAERYRVIWIEDDYRYHNHEPLDWGGCFCDLHLAEFNRRAGAHAKREEIVRTVLAPGQPHPWRQIWLDLWQDNALDLLAQWRDVVQAHGTQLGLMSSSIEAHAIEGRRWSQWWTALAGTDKPPIHRPHFWSYGDTGGKAALAESIAVLDQNRRWSRPAPKSGRKSNASPITPGTSPTHRRQHRCAWRRFSAARTSTPACTTLWATCPRTTPSERSSSAGSNLRCRDWENCFPRLCKAPAWALCGERMQAAESVRQGTWNGWASTAPLDRGRWRWRQWDWATQWLISHGPTPCPERWHGRWTTARSNRSCFAG